MRDMTMSRFGRNKKDDFDGELTPRDLNNGRFMIEDNVTDVAVILNSPSNNVSAVNKMLAKADMVSLLVPINERNDNNDLHAYLNSMYR
jgi:septum formation inhibitor MinC